jgi:hypothetical protein
MTILLPANPAQFDRFVGIGMKKTKAALGRRGSAGLAFLGQGLAARVRNLQSHLLQAFLGGGELDGACIPQPIQGVRGIPLWDSPSELPPS